MNEDSLRNAFYARLAENEDMQQRAQSHHIGLYTWICELVDRVGRNTVDLPREYTMQMALIGSPDKLAKCIEDLAKWKFIEILSKGNKWSGATKVKLQCLKMNIDQTLTVQRAYIDRTESVQRTDISSVGNKGSISSTVIPTDTTIPISTTHTTPEPPEPKPEPADVKRPIREHVLLTDKETESVVTKYGQKVADAIFDKLNAFKLSNGKKYASDYGAINTWVVTAVLEDQRRVNGNRTTPPTNRPPIQEDEQPFGPKATPEQIAQRQAANLAYKNRVVEAPF